MAQRIRRTYAGRHEASGHEWPDDGAVLEVEDGLASRLLAEPARPMYTLAEADAGATRDADEDEPSFTRGSHEPDKVRTGGAPVREDDLRAPRPGVEYDTSVGDKARAGSSPTRDDDRTANRPGSPGAESNKADDSNKAKN